MMDLYITILRVINEVVGELLMDQMKRFAWNNSYRIHYLSLNEIEREKMLGDFFYAIEID
jgi:hypothetical protein